MIRQGCRPWEQSVKRKLCWNLNWLVHYSNLVCCTPSTVLPYKYPTTALVGTCNVYGILAAVGKVHSVAPVVGGTTSFLHCASTLLKGGGSIHCETPGRTPLSRRGSLTQFTARGTALRNELAAIGMEVAETDAGTS